MVPSKGKRAKKAARDTKYQAHQDEETTEDSVNVRGEGSHEGPQFESNTPSQATALLSSLTVGFNSTVRHLENLAHRASPASRTPLAMHVSPHPIPASSIDPELRKQTSIEDPNPIPLRHMAAVFVPRSSQPSVLHSHLPLLVYTASLAHPLSPQTRLVTLPKGCETRLAVALGLPRVNFVGLMDGDVAGAAELVELVREAVPVVDVPWLEQLRNGTYLPANVLVSQHPVSKESKAEKRKSKAAQREGHKKQKRETEGKGGD